MPRRQGRSKSQGPRGPATRRAPRSDLGRRIGRRRAELGLSREEAAARAGTAPGYLQYLEEQPTAAPGPGVLLRLADALRTTVRALTGGEAGLPEDLGNAAERPELVVLSPEECRERLATHGVGRLAVSMPEGPLVVPVNYTVIDGDIAFRTAADAAPAKAVGTEVAFEVDHLDEALGQGWSVLVRGTARSVTDPREVRHLAEHAYSAPWAGGHRELWIRVAPGTVTGRRITVR